MPNAFSKPEAIIIVGASRDRNKYGNRAVRAYKDAGVQVFPINPSAEEIEGFTAYKSIKDVPAGKTTVASIYTQPEITKALLPDLAAYGVTYTFFNPGSGTDELFKLAEEAGIGPVFACSVTAIGRDPEQYGPAN